MADAIEGRRPVLEALLAGLPVRRVLIADGVKPTEVLSRIQLYAREAGIPVECVARRVLDERSARGAHQGVIAEIQSFRYAELAEVIHGTVDRPWSLIVALDHVTDPQNLGAVARSAEVAGADCLIIPERRAAAVGATALKASAGALAHIPVVRTVNLVRTLEELKSAGYWVAGASEHAGQTAWDAPLEGRLVIVLGAEGAGLGRLVQEACDFLVRVPVRGRTSSLNVASAAAVLVFEWVRRLEAAT